MKYKFILVVVVMLGIFILVVTIFTHQRKTEMVANEDKEKLVLIEDIQKKVWAIDFEKNYQTKVLNNEKFLDHMTDGGGQLTGYFKDGQINKVVEWLGLSYGTKTFNYYFFDGRLILVNEKEEDFPDISNSGTLDYTKVEFAFEGNYYFNEEKLIDQKTNGQKRFSEGVKIDEEVLFLKTSKQNVELLTRQN